MTAAWRHPALAAVALAAAMHLGVGVIATGAWAHVISAEPPGNSVPAAGPTPVCPTFNGQLQTTPGTLAFIGPDANMWSADEPTVPGAVVSAGVRVLGPAGTSLGHYRVTPAAARAVPRSWPFRLTVPGTPRPSAKPAEPDGELPAWPFAVGAIAAVAVVAIWSVRRRP